MSLCGYINFGLFGCDIGYGCTRVCMYGMFVCIHGSTSEGVFAFMDVSVSDTVYMYVCKRVSVFKCPCVSFGL